MSSQFAAEMNGVETLHRRCPFALLGGRDGELRRLGGNVATPESQKQNHAQLPKCRSQLFHSPTILATLGHGVRGV